MCFAPVVLCGRSLWSRCLFVCGCWLQCWIRYYFFDAATIAVQPATHGFQSKVNEVSALPTLPLFSRRTYVLSLLYFDRLHRHARAPHHSAPHHFFFSDIAYITPPNPGPSMMQSSIEADPTALPRCMFFFSCLGLFIHSAPPCTFLCSHSPGVLVITADQHNAISLVCICCPA